MPVDLQPKVSASARIYTSRREPKPVQNTKGKKPTGRNVGKLMQIMNVPVDVFLEIASHLLPIDILQLARVSKELRDMLMSRNTRSIWIAARKNVNPPLPHCPTDFSEPQYASLVFETKCMACGAARAIWNVNYAARVRLCGPCWKANIRSGYVISKEAGITKDAAAVIFNMLPDASGVNFWKTHTELQQTVMTMFYEAEFIAVVKKYEELQANGNEEALKRYIDERSAKSLERLNFQTAMRTWESGRTTVKCREDHVAYASRKAAIMDKLQELGIQKSDLPSYDIELNSIVSQPRPLTTRIWNTIRPKLIRIVEAEAARREKEAFKQKWRKRIQELSAYYNKFLTTDRKQHPYKRILPNVLDALELPCVQLLLTSAEPQDALAETEFTAIVDDLRRESESLYCAQALSDFAQCLREQRGSGKKKRSATSQPKPTGKTRTNSGKRKGKKRATNSSDSDEESDKAASGTAQDSGPVNGLSAADQKALNAIASGALFGCTYNCDYYMTYTQAMEHWQMRHRVEPWSLYSGRYMKLHGDPAQRREVILPVLKALDLPETSTVADFDAVAEPGVPGSLKCSCGRFQPQVPLTMHHLSYHCNTMHSSQKGKKSADYRITFVPLEATTTKAGTKTQAGTKNKAGTKTKAARTS